MVDAGSKGNIINICQIIACVGQQNVQGKRIPYGFKDRTLPHFKKDDLGPESRGFVANSYLEGLTPQEMFFHAMGGREGLVDTAVKTAETGYIQRRLVKAMEHLMIQYDGTVRNSLGDILQYLYGEDGIDGAHVEQQVIESVWMNKTEFEKTYVWNKSDLRAAVQSEVFEAISQNAEDDELLEFEAAQLRKDRLFYRENIAFLNDYSRSVYLPVNVERLVSNSQKIFSISPRTRSDLDPREVIRRVQQLCEQCVAVRGPGRLRAEARENATILFRMQLRSSLGSKLLVARRRLTTQAFSWLADEILGRFRASLAEPGEMIGTLAAQSIGEPATQMTLNTFHYAGVSAKNVTLGVPRLRELINVSKQIRTPGMTVHLRPELSHDAARATELLNKLEHATLRDITASAEVYYDPVGAPTIVEEDAEFLQAYSDLPVFGDDEAADPEELSDWVLRVTLDKKKKQTKGISNQEIADRINAEFEGDLNCVFNSDNAETPVLRVRVVGRGSEEQEEMLQRLGSQDDAFLRKVSTNLLARMALRGVRGVTKVFMQKVQRRGFSDRMVIP
ncbi:DNA-directed RNA polymerase II subunit rpb1, partial [Bonamia ostreae]